MKPEKYTEDVSATVDEMAEEIWRILFSLGPVRRDVAFRQSASGLYQSGHLSDPEPEPKSDTHELLNLAFQAAVTYGFLDMPDPSSYRAILTDPADLEQEDWEMCLTNAIEETAMSREDAIKATETWIEQNIGLSLKKKKTRADVRQRLDAAINQAIKNKLLKQTVFYGVEKLQVIP